MTGRLLLRTFDFVFDYFLFRRLRLRRVLLALIVVSSISGAGACQLPIDCADADGHCDPAAALALYSGFRTVSVIAAGGGNGAIAASYDEGLTWTLRAVIATSNPIGGVTGNGSGVWVAVGGTGISPEIYYSRDAGRNWFAAVVPAGVQQLTEVAYVPAGGVFVAVGNAGSAVISPNGVDWNTIALAGASTIRSLEQVNGIYYAMGDGISFVQSTDGINWSVTGGVPSMVPFDMAVDTSGRFVGCGQLGAKASFSTDNGASWTAATVAPPGVYSGAAFVGDRFVCAGTGGATAVSVDGGVNWSAGVTLGTTIGDLLVSDGGVAIAASTAGTFYRSMDGNSWSTHTVATASGFADLTKFSERLFYVYGASDADPAL